MVEYSDFIDESAPAPIAERLSVRRVPVRPELFALLSHHLANSHVRACAYQQQEGASRADTLTAIIQCAIQAWHRDGYLKPDLWPVKPANGGSEWISLTLTQPLEDDVRKIALAKNITKTAVFTRLISSGIGEWDSQDGPARFQSSLEQIICARKQQRKGQSEAQKNHRRWTRSLPYMWEGAFEELARMNLTLVVAGRLEAVDHTRWTALLANVPLGHFTIEDMDISRVYEQRLWHEYENPDVYVAATDDVRVRRHLLTVRAGEQTLLVTSIPTREMPGDKRAASTFLVVGGSSPADVHALATRLEATF